MLLRFIEDVLIAVASGAVIAFAKRLLLLFKTVAEKDAPPSPQPTPPKKTIQTQFFVSLAFLVLLLLASAILTDVWRFFSIFASIIALLCVWGSFENAISFYPDVPGNDPPANDSTDSSGH